jgi:hypothetical protein
MTALQDCSCRRDVGASVSRSCAALEESDYRQNRPGIDCLTYGMIPMNDEYPRQLEA